MEDKSATTKKNTLLRHITQIKVIALSTENNHETNDQLPCYFCRHLVGKRVTRQLFWKHINHQQHQRLLMKPTRNIRHPQTRRQTRHRVLFRNAMHPIYCHHRPICIRSHFGPCLPRSTCTHNDNKTQSKLTSKDGGSYSITATRIWNTECYFFHRPFGTTID